MPIPIRCACGKQLKVPDAYAGRRIKCNACGQSLTAPGTAPSAAPPASPPDTLVFACACGRQMSTKAEFAGRTVKCPGCGQQVTVPAAAPAADPDGGFTFGQEPAGAPPGADFSFAHPAVADDGIGARRRRRAGLLWVFTGVAALLVLAGLGIGGWLFFRGTSADMALIPADAQGFVSVRVADLWSGKIGEDLRKRLPPSEKKRLDEFEAKAGLGPADVERLTLVFPDLGSLGGNNPAVWAVVSLSKPLDVKKVAAALQAETTEKKHKDRTYHLVVGKGADEAGLCPITPRLVVLAPGEAALKAALDQIDRRKTDGPLAPAIRQASGRNQIVAAVAPPAELLKLGSGLASRQMPDAAKAVEDLKTAVFLGNVSNNSLDLDAYVTFGKEDSARATKGALDKVKGVLPGLATTLPGPKEVQQEAETALKSLSIEQKGSEVSLKAKLPANIGAMLPIP